jgi:hypothetical protein
MTIDISNNDPRISYSVAEGVTQTTFDIPFEFFEDSDVNIYVDGVLKTITTDYTLTGGDGSTGTAIISVTGASGGSTVVIARSITIERTSDFTAGVDINRAALNTQLDKLTAISADIKDLNDRSVHLSESDPADNLEIPAYSNRLNKSLGFDATGDLAVSTKTISQIDEAVNTINNLDTSSGVTVSQNITYDAGETNDVNRTVRARLRDAISVKDFGAEGDGSTNDYTAFVNAMAAGKTVYVPAGTYVIGSALTLTGHFVFDEGAKIKANAALVFNMSIEAGSYQIGEHGTGSIEWSISHDICVEWLGVLTSNTASVNKTNYENFLKYSNPTTYPYVVKFGRGSYPYEAPFYITSRIAVEGQTMFASELTMSGSDEHGVESCEIDGNAIVTDGTMDASTVYSHFRNMEVNCTAMTFTGNVKKFMFYGVGVSSSIIEGNRFGCDGSFQNNMDGIFLGPTYFSEVTDSTKNRASNRNTVRNNRITNFRDGIVLGRHNQTKTDREPAGGGSGDFVGGACFENTIGPRNILRGNGTEAARPRFGIVAHYYNIDSSTAPNARPKPYAVNVYGNTVLEFDSGTSNLTGTIAVTSGSATVTGTGTSFTTELPNDLSSGVPRRLAIGFTHSSTSYMFEVASIDSDTQLTLKSSDLPNITQSGLTVDTVRSGVALFTGSEGQNMVFRDHYVDHWCFPIQLTSNSKGASFYDNHSAGSPLLHLEDNSDADSNTTIRIHTPGFESRTNGVKDSSTELNKSYFKGRSIVYNTEFEEGPELTISGGEITVTQSYHQVDTQGDAATDDLDTINGGTIGQILILRAQSDSRTVIVKDGTGNLRLNSDHYLNDLDDTITLICIGTRWLELSVANNSS